MKQNQTNQNVDFKSSTTVDFVPDAKPELAKYGHVQKVIFYAKKVTLAPRTITILFILSKSMKVLMQCILPSIRNV